MLSLLANIGYIVFVAASVIFTLVFLTMSKAWFQTFMGIIIALFLVCMDMVCIYFGLRIWQVTLPAVDWVRLILFWLMGITMVSATAAFIHVQFSRRGAALRKRLAKKYVDVSDEK